MPVISTGHFKTMPVYGAKSQTPNHTQFRNNKPQANGLLHFEKSRYGLSVPI